MTTKTKAQIDRRLNGALATLIAVALYAIAHSLLHASVGVSVVIAVGYLVNG
jgi:hypothetical protein